VVARGDRGFRGSPAHRGPPLKDRRSTKPGSEANAPEALARDGTAPDDYDGLELAESADTPQHDHSIDPVDTVLDVGLPRPSFVRQGDRLKAYRPISPESRREALEAGIEAYQRGDFFEAHELLEPAWMGTSDLAEREFYQGLIKLAAGYVHCVRGNPIGMARNLEGARQHIETALGLDGHVGADAGLNLMDLVMEIEVRIKSIQVAVGHLNTTPTIMLDLADAAPKLR
jgi:hypothetical protein